MGRIHVFKKFVVIVHKCHSVIVVQVFVKFRFSCFDTFKRAEAFKMRPSNVCYYAEIGGGNFTERGNFTLMACPHFNHSKLVRFVD